MNLNDKLVFITGAASGIGQETSILLAKQGAKLALADINTDELKTTAELIGSAVVFTQGLDVSNERQFSECAKNILEKIGTPDVIVNNAGVGLTGGFEDCSLKDWQWILDINLKGVIHGCHFFAPPMLARGSGQIVNVASGLGLFGAPNLAAYCTSKFAVVGLSESLRVELATKGIGVSVICPGVVKTGITQTMRVTTGDSDQVRSDTSTLYNKRNYTPDKVAKRILTSIEKNLGLVPVCAETHIAYSLKRLFPSLAPLLLHRLMDSVTNK